MTMLGAVDRSGVERFASADNRDCHAYLTARGFVCDRTGWHAPGRIASITFYRGLWHVAISFRR